MLTYLQSLNKTLLEVLSKDEKVYLIGEDICDPYGGAFKVTKGLSTKFPGRVLNTPISEAGITGIAIGMSLRGLRPVLEIMFGDFLTLAMDQIFTNLSKLKWMYSGQVSVPIVIRTPMGGRRGYGPTHSQCLEKFFFGMPGIEIISPSYFHDPGLLLKKAIMDNNPVLFIEHKLDYQRKLKITTDRLVDNWFLRFTENYYPTVAISATDFDDDQITVITYGGMTYYAEEAMRKLLYEKEITSEIIIPSLIKPIQLDDFIDSIKKTGRAIIIEEGTLTNGWGAEIAALLSDKAFKYLKAPIKRVAAKNLPIANTKVLEDCILPSVDDIICAVGEIL